MTHTRVKIQSQNGEKAGQFTPFGGAVLINEFYERLKLGKVIDEQVALRSKSNATTFKDSIYIKSLLLMQLLGGDTVDDLEVLRNDPVIRGIAGAIPGRTSVHNYLASFANPEEESQRGMGRSFIPEKSDSLKGFGKVTKHLLECLPAFQEVDTVTLDQDATFIPTGVAGALYNYKSERSFEAFNTYCPEYDMIVASEFRDGNVGPGYRQLENLKEALEVLPGCVRKVRIRSDTAGYQSKLLKYCAEGRNERFGAIEFAIGAPVCKALKEAVQATVESAWRQVSPESGKECAEIVYAPNSLSFSKKGPEYRFIAIREKFDAKAAADPEALQRLLFDGEDCFAASPLASVHPTLMAGKIYKVFAVVTNMSWAPKEIISWYHARCGKSEEIHHVLKGELAGGHVVTSSLGANAAWWQISVLTANILNLMKNTLLPGSYRSARPKRLRFRLFSFVARLSSHARKQVVQVYRIAASRLFCDAWEALLRFRFCLE